MSWDPVGEASAKSGLSGNVGGLHFLRTQDGFRIHISLTGETHLDDGATANVVDHTLVYAGLVDESRESVPLQVMRHQVLVISS